MTRFYQTPVEGHPPGGKVGPMEIAGIGYQGRSVEDLIRALGDAQIGCVIDVRDVPWSRKPGFSKSQLAASLAAAGIGYVHLRAAGNPRENRKTARSTQEALARYREHIGRLGGLDIDALLPGHLLFTLGNGQRHIDLAIRRLTTGGFVPYSIGQAAVSFLPPAQFD